MPTIEISVEEELAKAEEIISLEPEIKQEPPIAEKDILIETAQTQKTIVTEHKKQSISELDKISRVDDRLVSTPIVPKQTAAQPTVEKEEKEPQLQWQNFKMNKILSLVWVIAILVTVASWFLSYSPNILLTGALGLVVVALAIYHLRELDKYLSNFTSFSEIHSSIKYIFIGIGVLAVVVSYVYIARPEHMKLILAVPGVLFYALLLIFSWRLWRDINDHIGGIEALGMVLFISLFIPVVWLVVPWFLYKLYDNAEYYSELNGTEGVYW